MNASDYYPFYPAPWTGLNTTKENKKYQTSLQTIYESCNEFPEEDSDTDDESLNFLSTSSRFSIVSNNTMLSIDSEEYLYVKFQQFRNFPTIKISKWDENKKIITWPVFLYCLKKNLNSSFADSLRDENIQIFLPQRNCFILSNHWLDFLDAETNQISIKLRNINSASQIVTSTLLNDIIENVIVDNNFHPYSETSNRADQCVSNVRPPENNIISKFLHWLI